MTNKDPSNLGKFFADIICSPHNQNVMIRFVALAGQGKSWAALRLAYNISKYVALKKGGKPESYFNFEKDMAVISLEEVQRVMNEAQQYHILLLDDVAAKAMNARNFQQKSSKDLNSIIQTWRPNHNALITTQQAGFLVDVVWRALFNYEIEMFESHYDEGFVIAKVFRLVFKHNTNKIFRQYLTKGRIQYKRHTFSAPPQPWRVAYENERGKQLAEIRKREEDGTITKDVSTKKQTKIAKSTPSILEAVGNEPNITHEEIRDYVFRKDGIKVYPSEIRGVLKENNLITNPKQQKRKTNFYRSKE